MLGSASASEPMTVPDSELATAVAMAPPSVVQSGLDWGKLSDANSVAMKAAATASK